MENIEQEKLTRRDYFAAAALTGLMSNAAVLPREWDMNDYAEFAVSQADKLISILKDGDKK